MNTKNDFNKWAKENWGEFYEDEEYHISGLEMAWNAALASQEPEVKELPDSKGWWMELVHTSTFDYWQPRDFVEGKVMKFPFRKGSWFKIPTPSQPEEKPL